MGMATVVASVGASRRSAAQDLVVELSSARRTHANDEGELRAAVRRSDFVRVRHLHQRLAKHPTWTCDGEAMAKAVEQGDSAFVSWHLRACLKNESSSLMLLAARHGHFGVLNSLWSAFRDDDGFEQVVDESALVAVREGTLEAVRWFFENVKNGWAARGFDVAVESKRFDIVEYFIYHQTRGITANTMDRAAANGHLNIVQWLHDARAGECTLYAIDRAATNGHLDVVQWLQTNRSDGCTTKAMDGAATNGHFALVQWLHANRTEGCTMFAMDGAASNGHLEIVQWLQSFRTEGCTTKAMDGAAGNGHIKVVQWLHEHRSEGSTIRAMDNAAANGHLTVVQWLQEHRQEGCSISAIHEAARNGHLDVVKWLRASRTEGYGTNLVDDAARNGHLDVVQWLYATESAECSMGVIDDAARNGHLCVVKWLYANGADEFDTKVIDAAARNGHLNVVKWLHEHWREISTANILRFAERDGHTDVVEWFRDHEAGEFTVTLTDEIAQDVQSKVARYLLTYGREWCTTSAMNDAARNGHLHIVKWLHSNRLEGCTSDAVDSAARNGHLDVIQWLHENRTEGCTPNAMDNAARHDHLDVVRWLHAYRTEGCTATLIDWLLERGRLDTAEWLIRNRTEIRLSAGHLHRAVRHRQLSIVMAHYDREELKCWPRPVHAGILFSLFRSSDRLDLSIFDHIVSMRKLRYHPDAPDNPYYAQDDGPVDQCCTPILLTSVARVCQEFGIADVIGTLISAFIVADPSRVYKPMDAVKREWVHWLFSFSKNPSQYVQVFSEIGKFVKARLLHQNLRCHDRLHCSKHFMYWTMEKADFEFVEWHVLNCEAHSFYDWLYAAVWVNRADIIEWMRQTLSTQTPSPGIISYKMFHALDASFATVAARFDSELMAAEGDERSIDASSLDKSVNAMDLAAIYGKHSFYTMAMRLERVNEADRPRLRCTVSGLYGAIINGHIDIVQSIYRSHSELTSWPRIDDGPDVLRSLLNPVRQQMLKYFRHDRGMRLEPTDLDKAAFLGDSVRVKLFRDLDLVAVTTNSLDIAALRNDMAMLKTLAKDATNPKWSARAMDGAAEGGHLAMAMHLHKHNAPCTRRAIDLAAGNGYLEVIQYLIDHRQEGCSEWAIFWACARRHADVVTYLVSREVACDIDKCTAMVRALGYLEIDDLLMSYRAVLDQKPARQRSSRCLTRGRRQMPSQFDTSPSRSVYREFERLIWPNGRPHSG